MENTNRSDKTMTLNVKDAAEYLGICPDKIYALFHSGQLRHKRVGKKFLTTEVWLENWLNDDLPVKA